MSNFITKPPGQRDSRGRSNDLWSNCPIDEIRNDFGVGYYWDDDFMSLKTASNLPTERYIATAATSGTFEPTIVAGDMGGGVAQADSGATTATQGINVQLAGENFILTADTTCWFEGRVKATDMATGPEFFFGLAEVDPTIINGSAVTTANHIGFSSVTDNGILLGNGEKVSTGAVTAAAHTLVEDTWVKLGFYVSGVSVVNLWVDGVRLASSFDLPLINIPIVGLTPSLVCQSGGTTDPIVSIDWGSCYILNRKL